MDLNNILVNGGTGVGFLGLFYFTLTFLRATKNDTLSAYSDLYAKATARCDELEKQLKEERQECQAELAALEEKFERKFNELEIKYQQQGLSTAALLERRTSPQT